MYLDKAKYVDDANKELLFHNVPVFSLHAYRTRQMSINGGKGEEKIK